MGGRSGAGGTNDPVASQSGAEAEAASKAASGGDDEADRGPDPLTYERARDELAQVVARLEAGGLDLGESLTLWERGEHLARICTRFLDGARQRVEDALARADQD